MSNALKNQLQNRLRENNISIRELERRAGLRINAVRNIVVGTSKKPRAETLQSIANVFGCEVGDLLGEKNVLTSPNLLKNKKDENAFLESPHLFKHTVEKFLEICRQQNYTPPLKQACLMVYDIYLYSNDRKSESPDEQFAEWLIKRNMEE